MTGRRTLQVVIGAIASAVCIAIAIGGLDLAAVWRALSSASYPWLVPALALYGAGVWVRAVRWAHLLAPLRSLAPARLFPVVVIGFMANNVLPLRLGELARCYFINRREGIPQSAALGTILVERVMDGLTLLLLMSVALPFLGLTAELAAVLVVGGVLFGATVTALTVVALRPALARLVVVFVVSALPRGLAARIEALAMSLLTGLAALGGARRTGQVLALSVAAWLLEAAMYLTLMYAFEMSRSAPLALLTTAVANIGALIPSSPGYVGVFEAAALLALVPFGVPRETALAYVLVVHAALVLPVTLWGFYYTWREGVSLRRVTGA